MAKIKKPALKKAQNGITYKNLPMGVNAENQGRETKPTKQDSASYKAGYNLGLRGSAGGPNERPVVRMGRWEGQNANKPAAKKKMQAGGTVKTVKRVGPVDPEGAYTKVQERTIAGAKAPKVPLKKDKELGATKMKSGGKVKKNWIQGAVNPAHKGYCTPMTKATCTPKRKALAKTFKAMAAKRKGK